MCYNNKIVVLVIFHGLLSLMLADRQNKFQPRMLNGYTCNPAKVPYFVIIHSRLRIQCGGSLLTYAWVLTAAHCILPKKLEGVTTKVYSGFDMPPEMKQVRKVKEAYQYPNFDAEALFNFTDFRYDIGLVLVDEPFHQTASAHVATLPTPGFTKRCNQVMTAGVGDTFNEEIWKTPMEQRPLKCVDLGIINSNICRKNYSNVNQFDTKLIICTYGPHGEEGPCPGDSGGPLICDDVVIGIVSVGGNCEPRDRPTVYAMVESYLDFIAYLVKFRRINIKDVRTNGTNSVGGQKPSDKPPANGTSVRGKKADKSSANTIKGRVTNWKLVLFALLFFFLFYC